MIIYIWKMAIIYGQNILRIKLIIFKKSNNKAIRFHKK